MKPLTLIVPGNLLERVSPDSQNALERLGVNPGWLLYFTVYNWEEMASGPDHTHGLIWQEIYETLMEDEPEELLKDSLDLLQANLESFSYDADNLYNYLTPFVGDLFLGREDIEIVGYDLQPFAGGRDTLIALEIEPRDTDPREL